jgi:hypothetical protein
MRKLTLILTALAIGLYACRRDGEEEITGELVLNELQANSTGDAVVLSWTWNGEGQLDSVAIYLDNSKVGKVTSGNTYTHTTTQTGTYKLIGYVKDKSFESNTRSTTPVSSSVTVYERSAQGNSGLVIGSDYKFETKSLNDADAPQKVYYYYTDCVPGSSSGPIYYLSSPVNGACNELSGFTITSYIKEDPSFNGVVTDPGNSTYEVLNSNRKYALKFTIGGKVYYALATTGASVGSSVTLDFRVQKIPNLRIIGQ